MILDKKKKEAEEACQNCKKLGCQYFSTITLFLTLLLSLHNILGMPSSFGVLQLDVIQ